MHSMKNKLSMENKMKTYFKCQGCLPGTKILKELSLLSPLISVLLHILCKHDDNAYNIESKQSTQEFGWISSNTTI